MCETNKTTANQLGLTRKDLVKMYETMILSRTFEYAAIDNSKKGVVMGNMHMSVGQEAVSVGVLSNLNQEDMLLTTHRLDSHLIAKGANINKMMAELMGKENGNCKGLAGKMHQVDLDSGVMCGNGIVGAAIPLGAGTALYSKIYNPGQVTVSFVGDGGVNTGVFHEGINLAAVWKLPVIFVVENNQYAISTDIKTATSSATISQRSQSYDIPGVRIDGNDLLAVYRVAKTAVEQARSGDGPTLIECITYRFRGHHEGDSQSYRSKEEVEEWKINRCPIKRFKEFLTQEYCWTLAEEEETIANVNAKVDAAVEYGKQGELIDFQDVEKYVYVEEVL